MTSPFAPLARRFRASLILLALVVISAACVVTRPVPAAAADNASVVLNGAFQVRAGYTGDGGIYAPSYSVLPCGTPENEKVRVREFTTKITKDGKTVKSTHRQMDLVRLAPGTYGVQAKVRYTYRGKTTTKTKTQTVKVTRKTDASSVSEAEYKEIKKGMTLKQVRAVVDGKGDYEFDYFFMEALAFDQSVGLHFVRGRVSEKWKTRNVYDWC